MKRQYQKKLRIKRQFGFRFYWFDFKNLFNGWPFLLFIYLNFKQAFCLDFNWYRFSVWLLFDREGERREILIHIIYLVRFLSFNGLEIQGAVFFWCTTSIYKMYKVLNLLHWHSYVFSIIKFVAWIALFDCWTLQFYSFIDPFHIQFCGFRRLFW